MRLDFADDDGVRKHFEVTDVTDEDIAPESDHLRETLRELKSVSITEEEARSAARSQFVKKRGRAAR